jgi:hypothetical protein
MALRRHATRCAWLTRAAGLPRSPLSVCARTFASRSTPILAPRSWTDDSSVRRCASRAVRTACHYCLMRRARVRSLMASRSSTRSRVASHRSSWRPCTATRRASPRSSRVGPTPRSRPIGPRSTLTIVTVRHLFRAIHSHRARTHARTHATTHARTHTHTHTRTHAHTHTRTHAHTPY